MVLLPLLSLTCRHTSRVMWSALRLATFSVSNCNKSSRVSISTTGWLVCLWLDLNHGNLYFFSTSLRRWLCTSKVVGGQLEFGYTSSYSSWCNSWWCRSFYISQGPDENEDNPEKNIRKESDLPCHRIHLRFLWFTFLGFKPRAVMKTLLFVRFLGCAKGVPALCRNPSLFERSEHLWTPLSVLSITVQERTRKMLSKEVRFHYNFKQFFQWRRVMYDVLHAVKVVQDQFCIILARINISLLKP